MLLLLCFLLSSTKEILSSNTGDKVEEWSKHPVGNPEELGDYFEGDIILPKKRAGIIGDNYRWPNAEIPYEIASHFPQQKLEIVTKAMNEISNKTCLKFREKTNEDKDYVMITSYRQGCYAYIGKIGGRQLLNLQNPGCLTLVGTAIHELLHAAGFFHEQSRSDRDKYVDIAWDNIREGMEHNFNKYDDTFVNHYNIGYDFDSVLHYTADAFSINGKDTIIPKDKKGRGKLGQRYKLSEKDAAKVNAMYNCTKT